MVETTQAESGLGLSTTAKSKDRTKFWRLNNDFEFTPLWEVSPLAYKIATWLMWYSRFKPKTERWNRDLIVLLPGQLIVTHAQIEQGLACQKRPPTEKQIRNSLEELESAKIIKKDDGRQGNLITINTKYLKHSIGFDDNEAANEPMEEKGRKNTGEADKDNASNTGRLEDSVDGVDCKIVQKTLSSFPKNAKEHLLSENERTLKAKDQQAEQEIEYYLQESDLEESLRTMVKKAKKSKIVQKIKDNIKLARDQKQLYKGKTPNGYITRLLEKLSDYDSENISGFLADNEARIMEKDEPISYLVATLRRGKTERY
jgi:hypothetical protein